ncbi:MAG: 4Fe-4S binding protein [Clostridia bacterium]|nr:4Fe-4S binding protein [Clostridia bacterium]
MIKNLDFFYFSPTGGTKKAGEIFCSSFSENITHHDLLSRDFKAAEINGDAVVFAAPVFGGRIPAVCAERFKTVCGSGKKIITLAVYGNRAYDDALVEMNDLAKECGFTVIASGALNAQHSMVAQVGAGRPDAKDEAEIAEFAEKVLKKLESGEANEFTVPGSRPYKPGGGGSIPPVTESSLCVNCGSCERICPTGAIKIENGEVKTQGEKCILCLACTVNCPTKARDLMPAHREKLNGFLMPLAAKRSENEYYL